MVVIIVTVIHHKFLNEMRKKVSVWGIGIVLFSPRLLGSKTDFLKDSKISDSTLWGGKTHFLDCSDLGEWHPSFSCQSEFWTSSDRETGARRHWEFRLHCFYRYWGIGIEHTYVSTASFLTLNPTAGLPGGSQVSLDPWGSPPGGLHPYSRHFKKT